MCVKKVVIDFGSGKIGLFYAARDILFNRNLDGYRLKVEMLATAAGRMHF